MMHLILFDDQNCDNLLPFTFMRPVADIRVGILTIREKWQTVTGLNSGTVTRRYLRKRYPPGNCKDCLFINAALLPDEQMIQWTKKLKAGQQLVNGNIVLMARVTEWADTDVEFIDSFKNTETIKYDGEVSLIKFSWDIFLQNEQEIRSDF